MSRFVSGGTNEQPLERDDEWLKAQKEIEETRRQKEEEGRQAEGKSLYEVLQANKVAKQEAFEEANRLKNQFRSLDEDEVEFLDSVLESTRAKEAAIRKETIEQLDLFRKQQEEREKATLAEQNIGDPLGEEEQWVISGRKRKKGKEKEALRGVKLRKSSASEQGQPAVKAASSPEASPSEHVKPSVVQAKPAEAVKTASSPTKAIPKQYQRSKVQSPAKESPSASPPPQPPNPLGLGLANYSSDEDD
ncbi:hypothetical protein AOQ84DRAFT_401863 [Glonium stellatum]|uniref:FAM192A/Fyv6 N-terminal domain-containing protein n=1 Tax=Glonium stellatum TaxID=574774 RepID=A0A8E2EMQ8_9PEZI|nr:hypothetical protein AOQ84DRAFT_401863 [Glonium stellatum]